MVESLPSLPALGAPTADAHAHLVMLDDPVAALVRAARAGVAFIASVVDLTEEPDATFGALEGWMGQAATLLEPAGIPVPEVRLVVGWHPHNASVGSSELLARLRDAAADPRTGGLGELGLDFHYDHSPRDDQRLWFRRQLELAHEIGLPVVIHLREAHDEGAALIEEVGVPEAGCIIHCFTEGPELATRFLALGCYISFAGPVTFKKSDALRAAAALVPLDRLLVETDCPFLAPHPYRGRRNEPAFVTLNAEAVARASGHPEHEVATAALENARRIFSRGQAR